MAHDDKTFRWPGEPANDELAGTDAVAGDDSDVLRNWLNRAPTKRRRAAFNPSLYTWKGYRDWKADVDKHWADAED